MVHNLRVFEGEKKLSQRQFQVSIEPPKKKKNELVSIFSIIAGLDPFPHNRRCG